MIAKIIVGRGNDRVVIERPRNYRTTQELSTAMKRGLGIKDTGKRARYRGKNNGQAK